MPLSTKQIDSLSGRGFSRRVAGMLSAGAAFPLFSEFATAQGAQRRMTGRAMIPADAVRISTNENPLGPCKEGLEAI